MRFLYAAMLSCLSFYLIFARVPYEEEEEEEMDENFGGLLSGV